MICAGPFAVIRTLFMKSQNWMNYNFDRLNGHRVTSVWTNLLRHFQVYSNLIVSHLIPCHRFASTACSEFIGEFENPSLVDDCHTSEWTELDLLWLAEHSWSSSTSISATSILFVLNFWSYLIFIHPHLRKLLLSGLGTAMGVFLNDRILDSNRHKSFEIERILFRFRCRAERCFVFVWALPFSSWYN